MSDTTTVNIYTDGGCRGNPGPGGWGVLLISGTAEKELWGSEADTTNNRMELTAVISALKALKRPVIAKIHTDSKYVQQGISTWIHNWKKNGWKTASKQPVKNVDLWQELDNLSRLHQLEWLWVKGHAGHPENERADMLANRAIDELLSKTV